MYRTFTDVIHEQSDLDNLIPVCFNGNCTDCEHRNNLEHAYNEFVNILKTSGDKVYNVKNNRTARKCPHKPGWSEYVKGKHTAAINFYKLWRDNGKPRQGPYYDCYRRSKLAYKYAVRAIKRKTDSILADKTANQLNKNDYSGFWDSVKKFNRSKTVLPQQIGKAVGENDICKEWKKHFHYIYITASPIQGMIHLLIV